MIDAMDLHSVVERTAAMFGAKGPRVIIACRRVWSTTEKPKKKKAHAEAQRRRGK